MVRRPLGQKSIFMGSCAVQGSLFSTLASGSALKPLKSVWKGDISASVSPQSFLLEEVAVQYLERKFRVDHCR